MDFKTITVHLAGGFTVMWVLGSYTKWTINSLAHKNPKNPKQYTAHNIS